MKRSHAAAAGRSVGEESRGHGGADVERKGATKTGQRPTGNKSWVCAFLPVSFHPPVAFSWTARSSAVPMWPCLMRPRRQVAGRDKLRHDMPCVAFVLDVATISASVAAYAIYVLTDIAATICSNLVRPPLCSHAPRPWRPAPVARLGFWVLMDWNGGVHLWVKPIGGVGWADLCDRLVSSGVGGMGRSIGCVRVGFQLTSRPMHTSNIFLTDTSRYNVLIWHN
jgi:hypothetical protein